VLDGVAIDVRAGEVLGLIGPNGAGKTTLFGCVAGLVPADGGRVFSNDRLLAERDRKQALFFVPDGIAPWSGQPAGRVLETFAGLFGRPCADAKTAASRLALLSVLSSRIGDLSKGERKRFALALGLLSRAPVLLFDEPFDGLDLRQTREAGLLLREEASAGRTLFLSIHQLPDAARVCDRLTLLSSGRIVGEGSIEELRTSTNLPGAGIEDVFLALT
jgi:ABC-2 type transport system ATP-binding protein